MPVSAMDLAARFALGQHQNSNLPAAAGAPTCRAGKRAWRRGRCVPAPVQDFSGLDAIGKTQGNRCIGRIIRGADFHAEIDTQLG